MSTTRLKTQHPIGTDFTDKLILQMINLQTSSFRKQLMVDSNSKLDLNDKD